MSRDDPVKQAAKRDAIDITGMNTETDETTGELIHHHQHPMAFKANRLTSEESRALAPDGIAAAGFQRPLTEPSEHLSLCTRLSRNHGEAYFCSTDKACVECRITRPHRSDHSSPRMVPPSPQVYRFPAYLRRVHGFPMLRLLRRLRPSMKPSLVCAASWTCCPAAH